MLCRAVFSCLLLHFLVAPCLVLCYLAFSRLALFCLTWLVLSYLFLSDRVLSHLFILTLSDWRIICFLAYPYPNFSSNLNPSFNLTLTRTLALTLNLTHTLIITFNPNPNTMQVVMTYQGWKDHKNQQLNFSQLPDRGDSSWLDHFWQGKPRTKTRQTQKDKNNTRQGVARQDKTRNDKTGQDKTILKQNYLFCLYLIIEHDGTTS